MKELREFYSGYPIILVHILSRTSMLYDQTVGACPLAGYGHYTTHLAMIDTGAVFAKEVTKEKFLDYLYQLGQFRKMSLVRNHGRAVRSDDATLLVYFDAGRDGITLICHLCYETNLTRVFYC